MSMVLRRRLPLAALAMLLVFPVAGLAQKPALGDVARKEQERRKASKSSDKVLTNKDLPAPPPPPASASGAAAGDAQAAPPAEPAEPETKGAGEAKDSKNEAYWKGRIGTGREALRRSEAFLEALQSRVNALSADFTARDDPHQRAKIGDDRQKALAEMARVQAEIAAFKKQIADIEEEARKAGVPPGWLR